VTTVQLLKSEFYADDTSMLSACDTGKTQYLHHTQSVNSN